MYSPMPWVKAYTEMLDDTKLLRLNDACCWRFMQLILLAGVCDAEGLLTTGTGPMSLDDIAVRLRVRPSRLAPQMDSLINVGLVENTPNGYRVAKFSERQGRKQSEKREKWNEAAAKARQTAAKVEPDWSQIDANSAQNLHEPAQYVPEIADKRKKSSLTHAPRVEKSREENTIGADAPSAPDPVKELAAVFEQAAKIVLPTPSGKRGKDQVGVTWWHPLREMVKMGNGNSDTLLRDTVRRMRRDGLTIAAPISCLKVFTSLNGERHSGPEESPTPEL